MTYLQEVRRAVEKELAEHWPGNRIPAEHVAAVIITLDGMLILDHVDDVQERVDGSKPERLKQFERWFPALSRMSPYQFPIVIE